jgi:hypothetical protein
MIDRESELRERIDLVDPLLACWVGFAQAGTVCKRSARRANSDGPA